MLKMASHLSCLHWVCVNRLSSAHPMVDQLPGPHSALPVFLINNTRRAMVVPP